LVIDALGYRWMFGILAPLLLLLGLGFAASLPKRA